MKTSSTKSISIKKAKTMYVTADATGKQMLEKLFGKKALQPVKAKSPIKVKIPVDITKRVTTFKDVLREVKETDKQFNTRTRNHSKDAKAYEKMKIIVKAFNGNKKVDYSNSNQDKFFIWLVWDTKRARFVFDSTFYHSTHTLAGLGPRLSFLNRAHANHVGNNAEFMDIINEQLM